MSLVTIARSKARAMSRASFPPATHWRIFGVNAFYVGSSGGNFGDYLTAVLLERIFGLRPKKSSIETSEVVGVGSLMEDVERVGATRRPLVWGAGFIRAGGIYSGPPLEVAAVRGALTLERLQNQVDRPVVMGDPGLLISHAYPELVGARRSHRLGVVPHHSDQGHPVVAQLSKQGGVHVINVEDHPVSVASQIASCEAVVSSSLHGLVTADSLGVPNIWMPLGELLGGEYKFRDYYSAFGEVPNPMRPTTVPRILQHIESAWRPARRLSEIQQGLIDAFPARALDRFESRRP